MFCCWPARWKYFYAPMFKWVLEKRTDTRTLHRLLARNSLHYRHGHSRVSQLATKETCAHLAGMFCKIPVTFPSPTEISAAKSKEFSVTLLRILIVIPWGSPNSAFQVTVAEPLVTRNEGDGVVSTSALATANREKIARTEYIAKSRHQCISFCESCSNFWGSRSCAQSCLPRWLSIV